MRFHTVILALLLAGCTKGSPEETARLFADRELAGDATSQRALLTDADGRIVDSASTETVGLLATEPILNATVDSVRRSVRLGDTVNVAVFVSSPNLEGLPDSIRKARSADINFLRARPRILTIDTVATVREKRAWRVSVDAAFKAGLIRLQSEAFAYDSSVAFRLRGLDRIQAYYRERSRMVPAYLETSAQELRVVAPYIDSLEFNGLVRRNSMFLYAPTLGTHLIDGRVRNLSDRSIYLVRLVARLASGKREMVYVFDIPARSTKEISEYGMFDVGSVTFEVAEIQLSRP